MPIGKRKAVLHTSGGLRTRIKNPPPLHVAEHLRRLSAATTKADWWLINQFGPSLTRRGWNLLSWKDFSAHQKYPEQHVRLRHNRLSLERLLIGIVVLDYYALLFEEFVPMWIQGDSYEL